MCGAQPCKTRSLPSHLHTISLITQQIFNYDMLQSNIDQTMIPPAVVLILGGGPRIGSSVARKFASQGFEVAIASRSVTDGAPSSEGYLQVQVDLSQPASVPRVFEVIKSRLGVPPSVVVYNGKPMHRTLVAFIDTEALHRCFPADQPPPRPFLRLS